MSESDQSGGSYRGPRGMADVLPEQMPLVRQLEETARRVFELYGYSEIRTPMFEDTRLLVRGIGEATDIVEKEMYTFDPASEDSLTLRPEATAPVVRAFIEHNLAKSKAFQKLYYIGPMFRKEKPQAGRMREFYQLGVEALGSYEPWVDAETILVAMHIFEAIGLAGCQVKINTIGDEESRGRYREVLKERLKPALPRLCKDCRSRYERNVFRVLDCKQDACRAVAAEMPLFRDYLNAECTAHFQAVLDALDAQDQAYTVDDRLVRGFDYYTRTVYEITHPALGARDAIAGGGRYDNLVAEIGGPPTGAVGFAIGELPTLLAVQAVGGADAAAPAGPAAYVVAVGDDARGECFRVANVLRRAGVSADLDAEKRSTKAQMRTANKLGVSFVIVIGPDELAAGEATLKHMESGEEKRLPVAALAEHLQNRI